MAKNKVNVDVQVDDNGTLKSLDKNAKAAAAGLNKTATAAGTADRNLKGAAQASSNGTKNFSKMAQGISGGLVPAYATLAANVFAITAAFQFFKQAGDLAILEQSQKEYAYNTGRSMSLLTTQLQAAARGMLSYQDAAQGAAIGAAAGLSNAQLEGLADAAYRASVALGRDLTDSFNRLTRGAIKAEPELLDELGIIIRLDKVTKDYAESIGTTAQSLTAFQRTQAVTNAILDQAATKFEDLGENVNQIARLGKSFQDLLKDIMKFIQPITDFIGKTLADNVVALAGAMALLGAPLIAALTPAAPAFTNIKEKADTAVLALKKFSNEGSKVGQRLKAAKGFDDLSDKDLNYLEASQRSKNSTILKYDNKTRKGIVRNLNIIKAQRQLLDAESLTGHRRYFAKLKAEYALLEATHGKTMARMKMAGLIFARGLGKLLGAVGIIGMVLTAIGLVKELIGLFEDKRIRKYRENVKAATDSFDNQLDAVRDIKANLKDAATASGRLHQTAQLLSNISFKNMKDFQALTDIRATKKFEVFGFSPFDASITGSDLRGRIDPTVSIINKNIEAMKAQRDIVAEYGDDTSGYDAHIQKLETLRDVAEGYRSSLRGVTQEQVNDMLPGFQKFLSGVSGTVQDSFGVDEKGTKNIKNRSAALKGLVQLSEEYTIAGRQLSTPQGFFSQFVGMMDQASQALATAKSNKIKDLKDLEATERNALKNILGDLKGIVSLEDARAKLAEKRKRILEIENRLILNQLRLERQKQSALAFSTPLQTETLNNLFAQKQTQQEIDRIMAKHAQAKAAGKQFSLDQMKQDAIRIQTLQDQLQILKDQNDLYVQLGQGFRTGLESGMQGQLQALIKGTESSFTDAILNTAKAALNSIADVLAKRLTQSLMALIPGYETPEQKMENAIKAGADYHAQQIITAMKSGAMTPGRGSGSMRSLIDSSDVPVTSGYTKKGVNPSTQATLIGPDGKTTVFRKNNAEIRTVFDDFTTSVGEIFDPNTPFMEAMGNVFDTGAALFSDIFGKLGGTIGKLFGMFGSEGGFNFLKEVGMAIFSSATPARYGGVLEGYSTGGIAKGSQKGFPAILHGTEAVVPLPHGNAIPVEMRGNSGGVNNVSVSVNIDNSGKSETQTNGNADGAALGKAVAAAVQEELKNQKRSGGILNPYGVA